MRPIISIICSARVVVCPFADKLADAIHWVEGGSNTRHPYGIKQVYRGTTPRQACLNTINHRYLDWVAIGSKGEFLYYLGNFYCPNTKEHPNQSGEWAYKVQRRMK